MFLETSLRVGGTETVVTRLMERFDPTRVQASLCCLYDPGILGERLISEGFTVFHSLGKNRKDPGLPFRLCRLLRSQAVNVLFIINQPLTQFWGTWCALAARVPVRIAAIRSTGKVNRIQRRLLINNLTFPWMTRVTALSEMHKEYLVLNEGINPDKIEIITNGVDLGQFDRQHPPVGLRASLGIPAEAPVVGIVAMLRPEKAHAVFIRAASKVLKYVPDAHFLLVGEGPERAALEGLAKELGIEAQVHFLGARSDVPAIINLFNVAVLSSDPVVETVSNAVLEYMAVRKPVVSTRVGSLPEMIDEGRSGFLVEPGHWDEMAEKIVVLLRDRALAHRMGEAGREKIERVYSIDQQVRNWESLFEVLSLPRNRAA